MWDFKLLRARLKRAWKAGAIACRNLPLTITSFAVLTCVELFTAGGIIQTTTETVDFFGYAIALAALEIGLSYGCGILSVLGWGAAAELAADLRPQHRQRARGARAVSTLLLAAPVIFFTNALAVQVQRSERLEYIASERYAIDRATALGQCLEIQAGQECYVDPKEKQRAQANLAKADEVKTARIDGAWFLALLASVFVYGTLGWANTALYRPKPETPWEARERVDQERREYNRQRRREREAHERMLERELAKERAREASNPLPFWLRNLGRSLTPTEQQTT